MSEPCKLSDLPSLQMTGAYVVKVGNRYFCGWNKNGVVSTAWSIQGAIRRGCFYGGGSDVQAAIKLFGNRRQPRLGFSIARIRFEEVGV